MAHGQRDRPPDSSLHRRPRQTAEGRAADRLRQCRRGAAEAERLAPLRLGVIAYSISADVEMGDYDENPVVLFKAGQLPPPWDEA